MTTAHSYSITRYLNARQATHPRFLPDGRTLVFLTNITGVPQIWQTALSQEPGTALWPEQLTFDADRVMELVCSPAPGDDRLVFARDLGGNEKSQLFLLAAGSTTETPLTAGYANARHHPGPWSADGKCFLFSANRRHPGIFDLYLQDPDGDAICIWQNDTPGYLAGPQFSPDGKRVVVIRTQSSFDHALFEIDLTTGEARQLLSQHSSVQYANALYTADGRGLWLNTDLAADFLYIAHLNLATEALKPLVKPAWDCENLTLSPDGRTLAYTVNVDGADHFEIYDLDRGTTRCAAIPGNAPGLEPGGGLNFSPDSTRITFAFSSANRTSDIFVWDLAHDTVQAVTRSSHGGVPASSFVVPELIHYPTFDAGEDGQPHQIPAWFYKPTQTGKVPAIVIVHGGPEAQYRPLFTPIIQYFVHHGYAVLAPNVRGSTGYGKAYAHLDDVEKRPDAVKDLAYAAHWLRAHPGIDSEHLIVYGGSYGGFMVLAAMTEYPDLWSAGVDIVGVSNFVTFLENTSEYRRAHREAEYGSLQHDRDMLERLSPAHHLDQIRAPLIVIHGANDPRVPLNEAEQVVAALQARQVPVEFMVFDDEGHGLVRLPNKLKAYPAIVDFLKRYA
ncbi:MAG: S9 family peptidase [Anaerolineae bacterium]|nr:S9 family peptidase [Anaerolineae bacterium]